MFHETNRITDMFSYVVNFEDEKGAKSKKLDSTHGFYSQPDDSCKRPERVKNLPLQVPGTCGSEAQQRAQCQGSNGAKNARLGFGYQSGTWRKTLCYIDNIDSNLASPATRYSTKVPLHSCPLSTRTVEDLEPLTTEPCNAIH
jgi:hypothetical protein